MADLPPQDGYMNLPDDDMDNGFEIMDDPTPQYDGNEPEYDQNDQENDQNEQENDQNDQENDQYEQENDQYDQENDQYDQENDQNDQENDQNDQENDQNDQENDQNEEEEVGYVNQMEEDTFKVVLVKMPCYADPEAVTREFASKGHRLLEINNVRAPLTHAPLSLFLLEFERRENNNEIAEIKQLLDWEVTLTPVPPLGECQRIEGVKREDSADEEMACCDVESDETMTDADEAQEEEQPEMNNREPTPPIEVPPPAEAAPRRNRRPHRILTFYLKKRRPGEAKVKRTTLHIEFNHKGGHK